MLIDKASSLTNSAEVITTQTLNHVLASDLLNCLEELMVLSPKRYGPWSVEHIHRTILEQTLDKGVIRVKRTGTGMYDTSYTIAATTRDTVVPEDRKAEISELPPIKDYYMDRYGNAPEGDKETATFSTDDTEDDLF